ncbi:uncharacterized protein LOC133193549 [Saccostrea echinata]|uniref:uncharacterized protein LOC133193549 n=1 Tax=Saccostrea echinata TaxID=191078 RepID=UPI002A831D2C|nr:uncharacterized protein LOC133193549 [Saccostrea echinata]
MYSAVIWILLLILSQWTQGDQVTRTDVCSNSGKFLKCETNHVLKIKDVICMPNNYTCPEKDRIVSICEGQKSCESIGLRQQLWTYCQDQPSRTVLVDFTCESVKDTPLCRTNLCSEESRGLLCPAGSSIHVTNLKCGSMNPEYTLHEVTASTSNNQAMAELTKALEEDQRLPVPISNEKPKQRFKSLTVEELDEIESKKHSSATKAKTKWGVKILQDWSLEKFGHPLDLQTISREELNNHLRWFYTEVQPKLDSEKENKISQPQEYHKNTLKGIRSAISRHLSDIGRDFDIVRDKAFKQANGALTGKLKQNMILGLSRPTQHKAVVSPDDLSKISTYLTSSLDPVILRYRVWFNLSLHFVSRGLEFHHQLSPKSFLFLKDDNGMEYVSLSHETKQKNWQGGLDNQEAPQDKRMYATGDLHCPIASLRTLIQHTDPQAQSLFNHCTKEALSSPETTEVWYMAKPCKQYQFSKFMPDISRNAGCSKKYTAHCLRSTAIQALNDEGFEIRHIMYMSGHRNEASVRSYSRDCSTTQKHQLSSALAKVARPSSSVSSFQPSTETAFPCTTLPHATVPTSQPVFNRCPWNLHHVIFPTCEGKQHCQASGLRMLGLERTCVEPFVLADYICIQSSVIHDTCTGYSQRLPARFGVIKSPGFPQNPDGNPNGCVWKLSLGLGKRIDVTVHLAYSREETEGSTCSAKFLHVRYVDCRTMTSVTEYFCQTHEVNITRQSCGDVKVQSYSYFKGDDRGNRFLVSYEVVGYNPKGPSYVPYILPCGVTTGSGFYASSKDVKDGGYLSSDESPKGNGTAVEFSFNPRRFSLILKIVMINFLLFIVAFILVMSICLVCYKTRQIDRKGNYEVAKETKDNNKPGTSSVKEDTKVLIGENNESTVSNKASNHFSAVQNSNNYDGIYNEIKPEELRGTTQVHPRKKNPYASYDSLDFDDGISAEMVGGRRYSARCSAEIVVTSSSPTSLPHSPAEQKTNQTSHQDNHIIVGENGVPHVKINNDFYAIVQKPNSLRNGKSSPYPRNSFEMNTHNNHVNGSNGGPFSSSGALPQHDCMLHEVHCGIPPFPNPESYDNMTLENRQSSSLA